MKKVLFSLLALLVLSFSSCNLIFSPPDDPIVGDWELATWNGNAANSVSIWSRDMSVTMAHDHSLSGSLVEFPFVYTFNGHWEANAGTDYTITTDNSTVGNFDGYIYDGALTLSQGSGPASETYVFAAH